MASRARACSSIWDLRAAVHLVARCSGTALSAYVRVRKKDTGERQGEGEEDGHVPPVARDQPNGFRLTPHTPLENQSTPSLVTLAEPPGNAGSKHARRNTVILLALVSIPLVPSLLIRFSSSPIVSSR